MVHHFNGEFDDDGNMEYDTDVYFPGIKERMYADISTDKVDAGVKETLSFQNYSFGKTTIPGTDFSVRGDVAHDHFLLRAALTTGGLSSAPSIC